MSMKHLSWVGRPLSAMVVFGVLALFWFGAARLRAQDYLACPPDLSGYLRPLLSVGNRGEIRADGVPTRARSAPTLNADIAFQIEPGTSFTVIGGPACADGYLWWRVAYAGFLGWTAESSIDERIYYFQGSTPPALSARAIISRETLGSLRQLPFELPSIRFDLAEFAPLSVVSASDSAPAILASDDPTRAIHRLAVTGRVIDAAFDSSGTYVALGVYDPELNRSYVARYRSFADSNLASRAELNRLDIDVGREAPLVGVAIQPPYLLTLHGDGETSTGEVLIWSVDDGILHGRVELPMTPASMVADSTGQVVAVSASGGAGAQTVLIDLRLAEIVARAPDYGVLAWNPYPGSGREQLFVGKADGTVAVYLALPSEGAQPPNIVPARLERLGDVEVFIRRAGNVTGVGALALDPQGQLLAVGGVLSGQSTAADFAASIAFVDLATYIVSAESLRDDGWSAIDQLGFSSDGSALWVGYNGRGARGESVIFGVMSGG